MRLLAFDFDGTLADTEGVIFANIEQTLQSLGRSAPPPDVIRQYIGLPLATIFARICQTSDQEFIDSAVKKYRASFHASCKGRIRLFPHVREGLENFRKAGLKLAVGSSRERNSLLNLLGQLEITGFFDLIAGEQDVRHPKPAPDLARFILERTGVPADQAMFIGDTSYDIGAGKSAGLVTCGVSYGNQSREELARAGAEYVVDSFQELENLVLPGVRA